MLRSPGFKILNKGQYQNTDKIMMFVAYKEKYSKSRTKYLE